MIYRLPAFSSLFLSLLLAILFLHAAPLGAQTSEPSLAAQFAHPPASARPWVIWFWVDGNVSREGITADLESMARVGIGGALLYDVTAEIPSGPVRFLDPQWRQLFAHAVKEAARLGLQLGVHNAAGWTGSGGPWITPELGMQRVVFASTNLAGPSHYAGPLPSSRGRFTDVATIAFPAAVGDGGSIYRLDSFLTKAGMGRLDPAAAKPAAAVPPGVAIDPGKTVDLSPHVHDGQLTWDVPPGRWTVLRVGFAPIGRKNHPAPPEGLGLECDKLSREAIEYHFKSYIGQLLAEAGDAAARTLSQVFIDSWEIGYQNWTPAFREEFRKRRGYDPLPWLPAMNGRVVGDLERSERFLWDVRRTIADLVADNYAGHFAELAHRHGLQFLLQGYANGPFDDLQYAAQADIPMGEFWTQAVNPTRFHYCKMMSSVAHTTGKPLVAAEAFSSYAEDSSWRNHPFSLKALGDAAFCSGVNWLYFNHFVHQPWLDHGPGLTAGAWGLQYDRLNTWWDFSRPWHEYLARCQYLLRQGAFVADLCYLTPEGAFTEPPPPQALQPPPPEGYDFDYAGPQVVLGPTEVKEGRVTLTNGMSYQVLVLPSADAFTPTFLRKIKALVQAGATVVAGRPPTHAPGLTDYPQADAEVRQLATELWGPLQHAAENRLGAGRFVSATRQPLSQLLADLNCPPDFLTLPPGSTPLLPHLHRRVGNTDIYFVANTNPQPVLVECQFRVTGKVPELWDPESGTIRRAPVWRTGQGSTVVPLRLGPAQSVFVVFSEPSTGVDPVVNLTRDALARPAPDLTLDAAGQLSLAANEPGLYEATFQSGRKLQAKVASLPPPLTLTGPWKLSFPHGPTAPKPTTLTKLVSWTDSADPQLKFFSGTGAYCIDFEVPPEFIAPGRRMWLDLGRVEVIARVVLNEHEAATLWKPPFTLEVTGQLNPGTNRLEVTVVNLWPNRLIGDEQLPDDCRWRTPDSGSGRALAEWPGWLLDGQSSPTGRAAFTTWKHWFKDSPLLPSGLLGPVTLRPRETVSLSPP